MEAKKNEVAFYEYIYTLIKDLSSHKSDSRNPLNKRLNIFGRQPIKTHKLVFIYHTTTIRTVLLEQPYNSGDIGLLCSLGQQRRLDQIWENK